MILVNLTDHDPLRIWSGDQVVLSIRSSGAARREESHVDLAPLVHAGVEIPTRQISYGRVHNLPAPRPGVAYVVSQLVVKAEPGRLDLFYPADLVRDDQGNAIGCRTLARTRES